MNHDMADMLDARHEVKRLCTICVRAGSKGVKNKNIRELAGLPLFVHSILQAKESGLFHTIAVSSDSIDLLAGAMKYGIQAVLRPPELATDEAPKIPVISHCVAEIEARLGVKFDTIADLSATAPLRSVSDIRGAVDALENCAPYDERPSAWNIISVCESKNSPSFSMVELDEKYIPRIVKPAGDIFCRQDAPKTYDMNGSIYVWWRNAVNEKLLNERTRIFVMPQERSLDIDTEFDFAMAERLMQDEQNQTEKEITCQTT